MNNRFFTDDLPGDNNNNNKFNFDKKNIIQIVLAVIGVIVLVVVVIKLSQSGLLNKKDDVSEDPNRTQENHKLKDDDDNDEDPNIYISDDVKEILDEYCKLTDENGDYTSTKMIEAEENVYELCSENQCLTTVIDGKEIIYYAKDCNESKYKKISKTETDVENAFEKACQNLDEDGNYTDTDLETGMQIDCQMQSCKIIYNSNTYRRSCVN